MRADDDKPLALPARRRVLGGLLAALGAGWLAPRGYAMPVANQDILCAPTDASILMARLLDAGALNTALPGASLRLWHDPDVLRAALASGRTRLFTTPTHVPANLANRGMPVKLAAVLGMGHLTIVSSDPAVKRLADLAGKPVLGFFRNDMPDLVFRAVAGMEGMDPARDFKLSYVGMPMEAMQMLAAGQVETAILSEPAATAAIMMAGMHGRKLYRAINLQDVWIAHKGGDGIPMIGVGVHESLLHETPELAAILRRGLPQAKDWVDANRDGAAALAEKYMQYRPPMFLASLDHAAIRVMPASQARAALEGFYRTLLSLSPGVLDGRLPDPGFYLDL
ncbi:ABC transporter substrate-binding protein [Dyella sedimenti]|uniref:ABC transporter substrate-binding protein n=1 Tax=Dyella sedimenti TaxID=2919947 RepID=UPI001FAAB5C7|nr:ABC transporter substrate-binding protein [Dyella sedimenti]